MHRPLSWPQLLQKLDQRGNYERTAVPRDISKLEGIRTLLKALDHPQTHYQVIHVAGTNGKGTTAMMISRLLETLGFRTGCYTSPHVMDIRERIVINGQWVETALWTDSGEKVLTFVEQHPELYISWFDIVTAIALDIFAKLRADWVVLETGLGGTADSTNAVEKKLAVLTPIGLDHVGVLGHSIGQISREKAGIARKGIPTVLSAQTEQVYAELLPELAKHQSPTLKAESILNVFHPSKSGNLRFDWMDGNSYELSAPETMPHSRLECIRTALVSVDHLLPEGFSRKQASEALLSVQLPGRIQRLSRVTWSAGNTTFDQMILDGGHNPMALQMLQHQLDSWQLDSCVLIFGIQKDKLIPELKPVLQRLFSSAKPLIFTRSHSSRAASYEDLLEFMDNYPFIERPVKTMTVDEALNAAKSFAFHTVIVAGSFYVAGEILEQIYY
ncbi:MAG: bifunctional folylpolyglutamate synthase/ dihydrofolate synthase [SAR324 cluster bacterium]|nr:bifunctional folylpolyglutamate synthase/ dihydrofolate synthase [SAR324 cluster bacterium]